MNEENKNPLLCDTDSGVCAIPGVNESDSSQADFSKVKPVKITYFTDPICSTCWGIEPQLRKLKLEYGSNFEIDYRMGGLLPDWSYNSGGISKPSDVASHWEEVSAHYDMPIDGDVWLEDPLSSSYPPSVAVKAAQLQDTDKAVRFMRKLRELLFLEKKNITRWEVIREAAIAVGLDTFQLKDDYEGKANEMFQDDLAYARKLGVRGFPTLFFTDQEDNQITLYGFKPYQVFESSLLRVFPEAEKKQVQLSTELSIFDYYPTLTVKEYAVIADISSEDAAQTLEALVSEEKLDKIIIKNGVMYKSKVSF
ncbi:ClpXP adapter SpxH family protein [Dyadobacter sp. CY312]|uniref:ClpXP adapter SpxH family protein n=1 Tax=Dyadobacter sp. CY312 TaxID=2907303 RepID=UPI001F1D255E|nr:ClpXP adapter SpxH family protein [Dyadobacter sp. CY312]MCE7039017.1 DsbA family protein [Dyadobacter sp. CY312]